MQYLNIIQPESRNRDIKLSLWKQKVKTFGHGNIPPYVAKGKQEYFEQWGRSNKTDTGGRQNKLSTFNLQKICIKDS